MPSVADIHIATDIDDLNRIAYPEKLGKNPKALENAIKNLYKEIFRETIDQEKCYILCYRYLESFRTLFKIGDEKFLKVFYATEMSRVRNKLNELSSELERRYQVEKQRQNKENRANLANQIKALPKPDTSTSTKRLFSNEFITVKDLFQVVKENSNILIVDIRPAPDYLESKIKFENIINIPEDIIVKGLSANRLGQKLVDDTQKIWDKRDSFDALVFLDWNSSSDITSIKLNYLKDSVVEWDCLRKYKQPPVIVNGGFKEFLDSYPGSVTNVHVNFIRNNEDIDELLELDGIIYPEPDQNVSIMPLKQFTIEELEESSKDEEQSDEDSMEIGSGTQVNQPEDASNIVEVAHKVIAPKGGGASVDISLDHFKEESVDKIKNKIQEQRIKLLLEARNQKNKTVVHSDNKENFVEGHVGDKAANLRIVPPPIRRETKPKKAEYVFGGWCGLVNIKNTCYMNTVLQCLKCIPIIRNIVHHYYKKYIVHHPPQIINEFASVIQTLCDGSESDPKIFTPTSFYETVCRLDSQYKKGNHEDCMEFFLFLFNHLNDDCAFDIKMKSAMIEREKAWYSHLQGRTSLWVDLFYHQFECTKICPVCRSKAVSYETDNTIMLPVPYTPSLRAVHLRDLINEYLDDNQILDYKCSKCQNLGVINKKKVVVAPEILVLVLKRYYQDEYYQATRKNNVCVDFDLSYEFGGCRYKLCAVAEHRGTMECGHYFAHGVMPDDVTWVEFNDERTIRYTGNWESVRGAACAFFYCKDNRKN